MRNQVLLASAMLLCPLACFAQKGVPTSYAVQAVPSVQLTNICTGINNQGQAVGWSNDFGHFFGGYFGWLSTPNGVGIAQVLYPTNGGVASVANAVNDGGAVAGGSGQENFGGLPGGVRTTPAVFQTVDGYSMTSILSGTVGDSAAINNSGQVVGNLPVAGSQTLKHAFFYDATSGVVDLGSLAGPSGNSTAVGVNATGQVVGTTDKPHHKTASYITGANGQAMAPIHAASGAAFACVRGVNDAGEVAGCVIDATGVQHAALTGPNGVHVHDLGALVATDRSYAIAVNASGVVIGRSEASNGLGQYFVTGPNGKPLVALTPLVTLPAGQVLGSIVAINNRGQICANVRTGTRFEQLAYVLTPVAATAP